MTSKTKWRAGKSRVKSEKYCMETRRLWLKVTEHDPFDMLNIVMLWNRFTRFGLSTFAENSGIKFRKNVIQNFNYPLHANIGRDNNRMPSAFYKVGDFWRMTDLVAWKVRKKHWKLHWCVNKLLQHKLI